MYGRNQGNVVKQLSSNKKKIFKKEKKSVILITRTQVFSRKHTYTGIHTHSYSLEIIYAYLAI